MINAIKIDAEKQTIEPIVLDGNSLSALQAIVGGYIEMAVEFDKSNIMYVNEEGLLRESNFMFAMMDDNKLTGTFAGNGVIVGTTKIGDTASHSLDVDALKSKIKFLGEHNINHHTHGITISKKEIK